MKHFLPSPWLIAVSAAILIVCGASSVEADTKSYHIGNSLTWDLQPAGLEAIAALRGHDHRAGYHVAWSRNLNSLWNDPLFTSRDPDEEMGRFQEALPNHEFDAVTLQPWRSGGATLAEDAARIVDFIDLTRSNPQNSNTRFYIYTGWPWWPGLSTDWKETAEDLDHQKSRTSRAYFDLLVRRVQEQADVPVYVVPVGEVFFQLEQKIRNNELAGVTHSFALYRDALHASFGLGRYVAGITTYATLFAEDPSGLTVPAKFYEPGSAIYSPELIAQVHQVIWDAVLNDSLQFEGDYDGNGIVDQGDLDLVLLNWGQVGDPAPEGWRYNLPTGLIDQDELDRVLVQWGGPVAARLQVGAVPEPATLQILMLVTAMALLWCRFRRASSGLRVNAARRAAGDRV